MDVKAYAKINLCLKVGRIRSDGYHDLDSLMVNIDLCDNLSFEENDKIIVETDKNICGLFDNLVFKAIRLVRDEYDIKKGVKVKVNKNIPESAGLGGGSSDAAATIKALNVLWDLKLSVQEMDRLALKLGSDVPFFIHGTFSRVMGKGEIIKELGLEYNKELMLIVPPVKCSTKDVYEHYDLIEGNSIDDVLVDIENAKFFNDLENTTEELYPEYRLGDIKSELKRLGFNQVVMSGSGSAIFAIGADDVDDMISIMKKEFPDCKMYNCKTLSNCK